MTRVFVYGTLKQGYGNNYLMEGATFVGHGQTVGKYRLLNSGFPVLWPRAHRPGDDRRNAHVRGEVYKVNDETLARLDRLEGEGHMYHRRQRLVRLDDGRTVKAHMYIGSTTHWQSRHRAYDPPPSGVYNWSREMNR